MHRYSRTLLAAKADMCATLPALAMAQELFADDEVRFVRTESGENAAALFILDQATVGNGLSVNNEIEVPK